MAGNDNIIINTLERITSVDVNDAQSVAARNLAEVVRAKNAHFAAYGYDANMEQGLTLQRSVVLSGLDYSAGSVGANITIKPGVLAQSSTFLTPTPGTYDSSYRIARLQANAVVPAPAVVSGTWYLLQAQMVDQIASSASRDVWDEDLQTYTPQLVNKFDRRNIAFSWKAGSASTIPDVDGSSVPILGCLVTGSTISSTSIVDLRPLPTPTPMYASTVYNGPGCSRRHLSSATMVDATYTNGLLNLHNPIVDGVIAGQPVWLRGMNAISVTTTSSEYSIAIDSALVRDPVNNPTSAVWSYLYLAPWGGYDGAVFPLGQPLEYAYMTSGPTVSKVTRTSGLTRGILVWSSIAPIKQGDNVNGAIMNLPAPFDINALYAGSALCIGAIHKTATGTYTRPCSHGSYSKAIYKTMPAGNLASFPYDPTVDPILSYVNDSPITTGAKSKTIDLTGRVPKTARMVKISIMINTTTAFTATAQLSYLRIKDTLGYGDVHLVNFRTVAYGPGLSYAFSAEVNVTSESMSFILETDYTPAFGGDDLLIYTNIDGYWEGIA